MQVLQTARRSRWRNVAAALALVAVSSTVALTVSEIGLRIFWPQIFPVHPAGMYTDNAVTGPTLTPNFNGRLQRTDFDTPFRVNSSGFRGPELRPRQSNTFRILSLGDSQTFGFGVADNETYCAQLERLLSERYPALDVQVINAGVPGFGTYSQLQLVKSRWSELDPDVVLLQFLPVNDFQENRDAVRQLQPRVHDSMLTSASKTPDEVKAPFWVQVLEWSKGNLHTARLVSERAGNFAMRAGMAEKMGALLGEDFSPEDSVLTQGLLQELATTVKDHGARALFLYSTAKTAMMRERYDVPRSRAVVEQAAKATATLWLDLNELMRQHEQPVRFYFVLDGHWSPAGHRVIAEILVNQLQQLSLVPATRGTTK